MLRWQWPRTNSEQLTLIFRLTTDVNRGVNEVMLRKWVTIRTSNRFMTRLMTVMMTGRLVVMRSLNRTTRTMTVTRTLTFLSDFGSSRVVARTRLAVLIRSAEAPVVLMTVMNLPVRLVPVMFRLVLANAMAVQVIALLGSTADAVLPVVPPVVSRCSRFRRTLGGALLGKAILAALPPKVLPIRLLNLPGAFGGKAGLVLEGPG